MTVVMALMMRAFMTCDCEDNINDYISTINYLENTWKIRDTMEKKIFEKNKKREKDRIKEKKRQTKRNKK